MKIKEGYNDKALEIRIYGTRNEHAEIWINEFGMPQRETLSYASLQELMELKIEIEAAIIEITGIKNNY